MIWQRGVEQEIADELGELTGFLAWQDREAMHFFTRSLEGKKRPRMMDAQRRAMCALYRRRWWRKLRNDPARYARYLAHARRWHRRWLRSLSPVAWRAHRAKAHVHVARYLARIRARPNGWEVFLERRRATQCARKALLASNPVVAAKSRARRRWLAARLKRLRRVE
jgi:hypothetical protein